MRSRGRFRRAIIVVAQSITSRDIRLRIKPRQRTPNRPLNPGEPTQDRRPRTLRTRSGWTKGEDHWFLYDAAISLTRTRSWWPASAGGGVLLVVSPSVYCRARFSAPLQFFRQAGRGLEAISTLFASVRLRIRFSNRRDSHYGCEAAPARERGLPLLAGVGATATLVTSAVWEMRPVLGFRLSWLCGSAITRFGAPTGTSAGALRPSPTAFAIIDRRSE